MDINKDKFIESFSNFLDQHFGGSKKNDKQLVSESETEIVKSLHEEERRALFVVLEPQSSLDNVEDLHGDYYDELAIAKACKEYNIHSRKAGLYHQVELKNEAAVVEESFISLTDFTTDSGEFIKKGTWLQWWHFPETEDKENDLWPLVKSGEINGVSVECAGMGYDIDEQ